MFGRKQDDTGTVVADLPTQEQIDRIAHLIPQPPAQETYQAQILADFQRAVRVRDSTAEARRRSFDLAAEAEIAYEDARKRLRRVSEGGI